MIRVFIAALIGVVSLGAQALSGGAIAGEAYGTITSVDEPNHSINFLFFPRESKISKTMTLCTDVGPANLSSALKYSEQLSDKKIPVRLVIDLDLNCVYQIQPNIIDLMSKSLYK